VGRRVSQCSRCLTRSYRALGSRPTHWLSIVPRPPSPPWEGRDGEGRSGSKGGEGPARGRNQRPRANGSPLSPDTRLVCCNDFKDATKVAPLLPMSRSVVASNPSRPSRPGQDMPYDALEGVHSWPVVWAGRGAVDVGHEGGHASSSYRSAMGRKDVDEPSPRVRTEVESVVPRD
jgi:hypothetical protein